MSESPDSFKLEELFKLVADELGDLLHAENMLLKAFPKLVAGSSSPKLKTLFQNHFEQTRSQVKRLEKMFTTLDLPAREKKCEGMMGLLVESQHVLTRAKPSLSTDQALISAVRKIASFQAVAYDSVAVWAHLCGFSALQGFALEAAGEEKLMNESLERMIPALPPAPAIPAPRRTATVSKVQV